MKLKIYLASSWRNAEAVMIIYNCLIRHKFEVDCFCNQEGNRIGFNIAECLEKSGHNIYDVDAISVLEHPAVASKFKIAYTEDKKWLDWANCVIMLMPCGRSAHLESGYMKGKGGLFYIYWLNDLPKGEFDNMYQFADGFYRPMELSKLINELKRIEHD